MFIFAGTPRRRARRQQRYVVGSGISDWIGSAASSLPSAVSRAVGNAGTFLSANKDTISNAASVIGNVANAGATTASAVKQIYMYDIVEAKRAAAAADSGAKSKKQPKPIEQELSKKSIDYLQQLARSEAASAEPQNINRRIFGSGFKTLKPGSQKGKVFYLNQIAPSTTYHSWAVFYKYFELEIHLFCYYSQQRTMEVNVPSDMLNIAEPEPVDESIESYELREYESQNPAALNSGGTIQIDMINQDIYVQSSRSYILIEGQLTPAAGGVYLTTAAISFINNAIPFFFSQI